MSGLDSLLIPYNDHDDATLDVDVDIQDGFEPENTQNTIRTKTLRSADLGADLVLTGVLPATRVASAFLVPRHHLLGASVALELFSDAGATSSVLALSAAPIACYTAAEPYAWSDGSNDPFAEFAPYWRYFTETAYRSYTITISGLPVDGSFYDVGRIWLGRYMRFARSPKYGLEVGWSADDDRLRTQGGSLRGYRGEMVRTMQFEFAGLNPDEFATLHDIYRYAGTTREIVVSIFPGDGDRAEAIHTIAGTFSALNSIGREVRILTNRMMIEES